MMLLRTPRFGARIFRVTVYLDNEEAINAFRPYFGRTGVGRRWLISDWAQERIVGFLVDLVEKAEIMPEEG